jgi:CheY-like chemotaxis protein
MVMPGGMTGRQLAGRLRKDDPGLPVIISSGYNPDASAAGPKGILYLPKPASVVVLAAAIRERLNLRSGAKLET